MTDFDWQEDPDIIVSQQLAIAIFWNKRGNVTILQEKDWCDESDTIITVAPEHLQAVIDNLVELAGQQRPGPAPSPTQRDTTAAERQRRYRQRKKVGGDNPSAEAAE